MNIREYLNIRKKIIDNALEKFLPKEKEYLGIIHKSMRYSIFAGGKRIRPILVVLSAEILGKNYKLVLPTACALELIHTYSLIHDDLPCMDNDDFRRGRLTNHKVFGEGLATLSGDALLTYAFELISRNVKVKGVKPENVLKIINIVSKACGTSGLIGGQVVDILSEGKKVSKSELKYIHTHKTGALICASLQAGAILSDAKDKEYDALTTYGENLGLLFQIVDDMLNVVGDAKKLGKSVGSDAKRKKITYPSLFGIEKSKEEIEKLRKKAKNSVKIFKNKAGLLNELVDFVIQRGY
ncbi:MAG: polyprenyl synthetase family protein [Candidatus Firestonebacteria bacterium]